MRCLKSFFFGFTLLAASALFDVPPAAAQYVGIGPFGVYLGGHRHYGAAIITTRAHITTTSAVIIITTDIILTGMDTGITAEATQASRRRTWASRRKRPDVAPLTSP